MRWGKVALPDMGTPPIISPIDGTPAERAGVKAEEVDEVILGHVLQAAAGQGQFSPSRGIPGSL